MGALYRIVNDEPPRPDNAGWLAPLLAATLVKDPAQRWSAAQVRDFLGAGPDGSVASRTRVTDTPTSTLEAVRPAESHTRVMPPAATPPRPARPVRPDRGRPPTAAVVLAVLAVLLLTTVAFVIGLADDDDPPPSSNPGDTPSSAAGGPQTEATQEGMEAFIEDYLSLVTRDPEAAFELLTPDYQEASGGLEGYLGFWETVSNTRLLSVDADPETLVVDYRYRYNVQRGPVTEDVSLQLELTDDGDYLIAGTAS